MSANKLTKFSMITAGCISLVNAAAAGERNLYIYNWSDYIDESVIAEFEAETGIDVTYDVFDSNEILETKLLAGASGYDLVVPSASFMSRQIEAGVFQPLDKSLLPNLKNVWPKIAKQTETYDPGNTYSINWGWGTTGIGVNVDKVRARLGEDVNLNSWGLLFDPENLSKLESCGVMFIDAPAEVIPAAMNYLGLDPRSTDKADLKAAEDLLVSIRPYVQKFNSSEILGAQANGDICISLDWSADVFQAMARAEEAGNGVNLRYIIPSEGALMWFDQMAIPADARNVTEAHEFMNFVMRPEIMGRVSSYTYVANGIEASVDYMDEAVSGDTSIYPDDETVSRLYTTQAYPLKFQRLVTRSWTRVKTGN
jgi:putrescine transport system substrate-binding protein